MSKPIRQVTMVFLRKDNNILLAMKKRGFGEGLWNGPGGKLNPDESIEEAAIRECEEETGATPKKLNKVAIIDFLWPPAKGRDQQVHIFFCDTWKGIPKETEEMKPKWFKLRDIPYDEMWPDDIYWMPRVLEGKLIRGECSFDNKNRMSDCAIWEVLSLEEL